MKMTDTKMSTAKKDWQTVEKDIDILDGVSAKYEDFSLTITGPKGEVKKLLKYPRVYVKIEGNKIFVGTNKYTKREKKIIFTFIAHINNMIKGVTEGFEYKLVAVYAKFPMTVEVKGNQFIVKNLLGEKVPRVIQLPEDVQVKVEGNKDITVTGFDKEKVGQVAASIEQSTKITHFDRRVIQDGIYITEKPHKRYS
jgi:large subunit ribosomal protein L6